MHTFMNGNSLGSMEPDEGMVTICDQKVVPLGHTLMAYNSAWGGVWGWLMYAEMYYVYKLNMDRFVLYMCVHI